MVKLFTKLFASRIVGGTIGPVFSYLKGKKTWFGLVGMIAITAAEAFLPVPGYVKPILDQIYVGLAGATVVSGGDKVRRIWEQTKIAGEIAVTELEKASK